MPKLAVVGQPISHSLSPRMQTAALEACGLGREWNYRALELAPAQFSQVIGMLAGDEEWKGVNATIPHKEAALAIATKTSEAARAIGAANTLTFGTGGEITADNTDAPAIADAVSAAGMAPKGKRALVFGAGGSARAAVWALRAAKTKRVCVWNRTHERAVELTAELGGEVFDEHEPPTPEDFDIVVNTTSVGLGAGDDPARETGATFKALGFRADQLSEQQVVVDLTYGSAETELIAAAKARGAKTVDGLEILVRQGARSFRIWTGLEPPLEAMERAVRRRAR